MGKAPVRVLVIDDSAVARRALSDILNADPGIRVIASAADAFLAAKCLAAEEPDVITLDVDMPGMDGITFLRKLMAQHPVPVVMCSSRTSAGSDTMLQAIETGAVDAIFKPRGDCATSLADQHVQICDVVKAAAAARFGSRAPRPITVREKLTADAVLPPPVPRAIQRTTEPLLCIGASTGGTEAIRCLLEALPADAPATVVVQHMPEMFTTAFARRLNGLCAMEVKEAEDGDRLRQGLVLIAPGSRHLIVERRGGHYAVAVRDGPLVARHRPSVDVLFRSAARAAGGNAIAALLTGMGDDGAHGLLELRQCGAITIAQDEASCVVFGMPKEAIALGAAERVLPLSAIAPEMLAAAAR